MNKPIKIKKEFKNLIRPLHRQEFLQLEENILRDGCLNPIITWNGFIVDGHNRYEICTKHNVEFNVVEMISDERVWDWNWHEDPIEIDGACYNVVSASYIYRDGVVEPGESTYPSLLQVRVHDGSQAELALYSVSQGVSIDDEDALTVLNERLGHDYEKLFNR